MMHFPRTLPHSAYLNPIVECARREEARMRPVVELPAKPKPDRYARMARRCEAIAEWRRVRRGLYAG